MKQYIRIAGIFICALLMVFICFMPGCAKTGESANSLDNSVNQAGMNSNGYEKSADLNMDAPAGTPLFTIVQNGDTPALQEALDAGADVNTRFAEGSTLLMAAVWFGREALVQCLIDRGALPELRDEHGDTPLIWALAQGNETVITVLRNAGATLEPGEEERVNYIVNAEYMPVFQ